MLGTESNSWRGSESDSCSGTEYISDNCYISPTGVHCAQCSSFFFVHFCCLLFLKLSPGESFWAQVSSFKPQKAPKNLRGSFLLRKKFEPEWAPTIFGEPKWALMNSGEPQSVFLSSESSFEPLEIIFFFVH